MVVENLNVVKRHTKPRPVRNTSRMGGAQVEPGGVITKPAPGAGLERDGRLPGVQPADPRRDPLQAGQGQDDPHARVQARRLRPGHRPLDGDGDEDQEGAPTRPTQNGGGERRRNGYVPRLKELYDGRAARRA